MEESPLLITLVVCTIDPEEVLNNHISGLFDVARLVSYTVEIVVVLGADIAQPTVVDVPENVKIKVVSENKNGVYHAFNKGISVSSGRYLYFANVGDKLNYLPELIECDVDMLAYPVGIFDKFGRYVKVRHPQDQKYLVPHHQGIFLRAKIYRKFYFNTFYKSAADLDFLIKVSQYGLNTKYFNDEPISYFALGGISSSRNFYKIINRKFERFQIIIRNKFIRNWLKFLLARVLN